MEFKDQNSGIIFRGLLAQLEFPVYYIRLINAKKIAQLLESDETKQFQDEFLNWLSNRTFESEAIAGLSVVGLLGQENLIDQTLIIKYLKNPSILAEKLIGEIYGTVMDTFSWIKQHSGPMGEQFNEPYDFPEISTKFVAPIFREEFKDLQAVTGYPFLTQWAWEFENLKPMRESYKGSPSYFFDKTNRLECTGSYHLKMTDLLHSAYLRTLSFAVANWAMPIHTAAIISYNCKPLDFQLGKTSPVKKPRNIEARIQNDSKELLKENGLNKQLESLINYNDEILISGAFPICREANFAADISIRSIFVNDNSSNIKVREIFQTSHVSLPKKLSFHEWCLQEKLLTFMEDWDSFIKEWELENEFFPTAFKIYPENFPRWQSDIILCGIFLPSPKLIGGRPKVEYLTNQMVFKINDNEVARWIYWLDNWKPHHFRNLNSGIGSALLLNKNFFESLNKNGTKMIKFAGHLQYLTKEEPHHQFDSGELYSDLLTCI